MNNLTGVTPPSQWVTQNAKPYTLAFTIECNMNTPFGTVDGYQAQAQVLGEAIDTCFTEGQPLKGGG